MNADNRVTPTNRDNRVDIIPEKKVGSVAKIEIGTSSSRLDSKTSSAARPGSSLSSGIKEGGMPFEKSFGGKDRVVGFTGEERNKFLIL